jgi:hypothetical protein
MSSALGLTVSISSAVATLAFAFASASAQALPIRAGEAAGGRLESSDPLLPDGSRYDLYSFNGQPGMRIRIVLRSRAFDAYLSGGRMEADSFVAEASDDDSAGGTDAALSITVGSSGSYAIRVTSYEGGKLGAYTLMVEQTGDEPTSRGATLSSTVPAARSPRGSARAPSPSGRRRSGRRSGSTVRSRFPERPARRSP